MTREAARAALLAAACSLPIQPASAQVLQLQSGSSTLFGAHGGSASVRGRTFSVTFGAGVLGDRFALGMLARKSVREVELSVGDEAVDFQLPTDLTGGSRFVPVRGAGLAWARRGSRARIFTGSTSETLGAPFFSGARGGRALGLAFYDHRLTPRLQLFSRSAFSDRQTSIHGLAWQPASSLSGAIAAGIGNDRPYAAASAVLDRSWLRASGGYVRQRAGFRRIAVDSPLAAEPVGEHAAVTVRPAAWWSVAASRQTLIDSLAQDDGERRVTVNQAGGSLNAAGFRFIAGLFDSHGPSADNLGMSVSAGRRVTRGFDVVVDYFRHDPGDARPTESLVLRLQETLSPRLSLLQTVTHSGGQTSMNVGGEFVSNPLRAGVTYQTVYAPLRDGNPFVQVIGVDVRVNVLDRIALHAGTYATPHGALRYLVSGSVIHSLSGDRSSSRPPAALPRYVVRGRVIDTDGHAVAGAVIHLDEHVAITDAAGCFVLRTARASRLRLAVTPAEFLAPGHFEVVSAPAIAAAALDPQSAEIVITVRRL